MKSPAKRYSLLTALLVWALPLAAAPAAQQSCSWLQHEKTLEAIGDEDQRVRKTLSTLYALHESARKRENRVERDVQEQQAWNEASADYVRATETGQKAVLPLLKECDWPSPEALSKKAHQAVFLVMQHATHDIRVGYLPIIERGHRQKKLLGQQYAYLIDRVRVGGKEKQVYGTQLSSTKAETEFWPIEDEEALDTRRAEVGLKPICDHVEWLAKIGTTVRLARCEKKS